MGICASGGGGGGPVISAEEAKRDKALMMQIKKDQDIEKQKIKLLLLGAGESGKTTVFKQMKILYGLGVTEEERKANTTVVYANVITSMKTLVENASILELMDGVQCKADLEFFNKTIADAESTNDKEPEIDEKLGDAIKALWEDPGMQKVWDEREQFQIVESVQAYFNAIDRIKMPDFVPTEQDTLLARVRTSGIVEELYKIDGVDFCMFDVGGQRNERKKWIHCFEQVTAVIFVAAISEYNQKLYEDSTANRMDEALELFDEICNSKWFTASSMILFLNKRDLLESKVKKSPIKGCLGKYLDFPMDAPAEWNDQNHQEYYEVAKQYWIDSFMALNHRGEEGSWAAKTGEMGNTEIYHHCTCATDTSNVKIVFNSCKDVILKGNLQASGFMD